MEGTFFSYFIIMIRREHAFLSAFEDLNRRLFEELQLASQEGRSVHSADMPLFGLESSDKEFFRALVNNYEMKVAVHHSCTDCCF
jgi:hypothetical protein